MIAWPEDPDACESLKDKLRECMPLHSMIKDLWNWDVHFEDELGEDWFFDAAFGGPECLEYCTAWLVEFFLETCERFGIDYNQSPDDSEFEALVLEEARKFILDWRAIIAKGQAGLNT